MRPQLPHIARPGRFAEPSRGFTVARTIAHIAASRPVGRIYPNDAALLRLATSLLVVQNDEWLVQKRYLSLGSIAQLAEPYGLADDDQPALHEGALAVVGKSTT